MSQRFRSTSQSGWAGDSLRDEQDYGGRDPRDRGKYRWAQRKMRSSVRPVSPIESAGHSAEDILNVRNGRYGDAGRNDR